MRILQRRGASRRANIRDFFGAGRGAGAASSAAAASSSGPPADPGSAAAAMQAEAHTAAPPAQAQAEPGAAPSVLATDAQADVLGLPSRVPHVEAVLPTAMAASL